MYNLIPCIKNCMHQHEGYCTLDRITIINTTLKDCDCIYFKPYITNITMEISNQQK